MRIVIVDGQGGSIGRDIIKKIKSENIACAITAVGTNSAATAAMLKAGADIGATGQNAVKVAVRDADIIMGPIGIICADAIHGEITPAMASYIGRASGRKILIPVGGCNIEAVGCEDKKTSELINLAIEAIKRHTT